MPLTERQSSMLHQLLSGANSIAGRQKLTILIFHQVLAKKDSLRPWEPDCDKFDWQMGLIRQFFNPLPLSEAMALLTSGELPPKSVCVTFDDGYRNNLEIALPILNKHGIPATVFVATAFSAGRNMWNDRVIDLFANFKGSEIDLSPADMGRKNISHDLEKRTIVSKVVLKLKYLPLDQRQQIVDELFAANSAQTESSMMMTREELCKIADSGIELGSHTHSHPILKSLEPAEQKQEILKSKELLEEWTGKKVTGFAYPNGRRNIDFDDVTKEIVRDLGFNYAVSTEWGYVSKQSDRFSLKRFTPWDNEPWKFHMRMLANFINQTP